jgi:hypothetical protein
MPWARSEVTLRSQDCPARRSTLGDANESRDWRICAEFAPRPIARGRRLYASESPGVDLAARAYIGLPLGHRNFMTPSSINCRITMARPAATFRDAIYCSWLACVTSVRHPLGWISLSLLVCGRLTSNRTAKNEGMVERAGMLRADIRFAASFPGVEQSEHSRQNTISLSTPRVRSAGASKSRTGPTGTIPVGLMRRWLM